MDKLFTRDDILFFKIVGVFSVVTPLMVYLFL